MTSCPILSITDSLIVGDEVVMVFIQGDGEDTPLLQLFGFQRVTLTPGIFFYPQLLFSEMIPIRISLGESRELFFSGSPEAFSMVTATGERIIRPGTRTVILSNGIQEIPRKVDVVGHPKILFSLRNN